MHSTAYEEMAKFAQTLPKNKALRIGDVGAYDVNGCLRPLFDILPWVYVGIDMAAGPNVDVVVPAETKWENLKDGEFDVMVSVSTLEHARRPWLVVKEMGRILKSAGIACIIAPYAWPRHDHPIDCWRLFPEGMKTIVEDAGLEVKDLRTRVFPDEECCGDTIVIARKP